MRALWTPEPQVLWSPSGAVIHRRTLGVGVPPPPPPAFVVGNAVAGSVGTSLAISKPAGINSGNFIVIGVSVTDFSISSFPGDLTQIIQDTSDQVHMTLFYKASAGGSDPSSWTFNFGGTCWSSITLVAYSGAASLGNSATEVSPSQPNTTAVAPSIAVALGSTRVCCFYGWGSLNSSVHATLPAALTSRENPSPSGFNMSAVGDFVPAVSPSGNQVATLASSDKNVGAQLALVG